MRSRTGCVGFPAFAFLLLLSVASGTDAQAWLPGLGRGTVSVSARHFRLGDTFDGNGRKVDLGHVRSNIFYFDLDYGVTRRLAVTAGIPLSFQKYTGSLPHPGRQKFVDDGAYHGGFQDFRFGARYALVRHNTWVVTPFVDAVIPSRDYEVFAHSAIGRNLKEVMIGANVGWQGEEGTGSKIYSHTRLAYGLVERVLDLSHNRTNLETELGYFLTPRFAMSGIVAYVKHHGGLKFDSTKAPEEQWTLAQIPVHDQLIRNDMFDVGAGASFKLNAASSLYANVIHNAWARNDKIRTGFIVGINWRFRTRTPRPLADDPPADNEPAVR